jgi:hypothetical protein
VRDVVLDLILNYPDLNRDDLEDLARGRLCRLIGPFAPPGIRNHYVYNAAMVAVLVGRGFWEGDE